MDLQEFCERIVGILENLTAKIEKIENRLNIENTKEEKLNDQ